MKQQNYSNHIRWYVPHHFIFYPAMLIAMGYCACQAWCAEEDRSIWVVAGLGFATITWLAYMVRQHYTLTVQNRIVLQELRYRYFVTTGKRFEPIEGQLTEGQLFALRFAPDDELPALADRALCDQLSPDAIKKSIKNWKPDHRRV